MDLKKSATSIMNGIKRGRQKATNWMPNDSPHVGGDCNPEGGVMGVLFSSCVSRLFVQTALVEKN